MLIEKTWCAVKVLSRPNPEEPFGCCCGGFVAEIQHCNQNYNKATDNHFGDFVVFDNNADDCPSKNADCIEVQHTKCDKKTAVNCYAQNVGDKRVDYRHNSKDKTTFEV